MQSRVHPLPRPHAADLRPAAEAYAAVRALTLELCQGLAPEDMAIQSMPDASLVKWHLAHTSWFFEHVLLEPHAAGYRPFHPGYNYLYNSYYYTVRAMHPRPARGLLSRPLVEDVLRYRAHVDEHLQRLIVQRQGDPAFTALLTLGLNHEQQHQEPLLMDVKHLFSLNPLKPTWRELPRPPAGGAVALKYLPRPAGPISIGHAGPGFAFDNETPRHHVLVPAHTMASR